MIERGGTVRAEVVPDVKRSTLQKRIRESVEPGSSIYSDRMHSYIGLSADYDHRVIDHVERYVDGRVHTNFMENFLVGRLHGMYISEEPFHLFRYLDERMFTFNLRELDDCGRFESVLRAVSGRRLTYAQLTGR